MQACTTPNKMGRPNFIPGKYCQSSDVIRENTSGNGTSASTLFQACLRVSRYGGRIDWRAQLAPVRRGVVQLGLGWASSYRAFTAGGAAGCFVGFLRTFHIGDLGLRDEGCRRCEREFCLGLGELYGSGEIDSCVGEGVFPEWWWVAKVWEVWFEVCGAGL